MHATKQRVWQALSEPAPVIDEDGTKRWYKNDELHRDNDQPAVIHTDGTKYWYKNGLGYFPNDKWWKFWNLMS